MPNDDGNRLAREKQRAKDTVGHKTANMFKFMENLAERGRLTGGKTLKKLQDDVLKKLQAYIESHYKG